MKAAIRRNTATVDMDKFNIEEALDCMQYIYKVQYKTLVANVATQVVERHLVRGLNKFFSPLEIAKMTDQEVEVIASETAGGSETKTLLSGRVQTLE
jgi:hypothetical protein